MQYFGYYARELPHPDYDDWKNTHRRYCRWRDRGIWESLLEMAIQESDLEWLIIDARHIKVHPHAAGTIGDNQEMSCTKGGFVQNYIITQGTIVDGTQSGKLIKNIEAGCLTTDKSITRML